MLFHSINFALFFAVFFILYWCCFNKNIKLQNFFLLIGSYIFYGWANWHFLPLLIGSSLFGYLIGLGIERAKGTKYACLLLYLGLFQGLGALIFYKYINVLIVAFLSLGSVFHVELKIHIMDEIIFPVGISFYTFKIMSYLIDCSKDKIKPARDWVVFFSYVAFFPCVMAGPIDKGVNFIPQLQQQRVFEANVANQGMRQILWGLFKKLVIANNCAILVDQIFENFQSLPASALVAGAFFYTIQIYADFSGYSDMAIGVSKLLGFRVMRNFNYPLFSHNIAEFWRNWNISLTSWLTEYVFTPLSIFFRNYGKLGLILAIIINFTLIGVWHGANWTFALFGLLHGCYFIPLILRGTFNKKKKLLQQKRIFTPIEFFKILRLFVLVMLTFIMFRADTVSHAFDYYGRLFSRSLFSFPSIVGTFQASYTLVFVFAMLIVEWKNQEKEFPLLSFGLTWKKPTRFLMYYLILVVIFVFGSVGHDFIYFQF